MRYDSAEEHHPPHIVGRLWCRISRLRSGMGFLFAESQCGGGIFSRQSIMIRRGCPRYKPSPRAWVEPPSTFLAAPYQTYPAARSPALDPLQTGSTCQPTTGCKPRSVDWLKYAPPLPGRKNPHFETRFCNASLLSAHCVLMLLLQKSLICPGIRPSIRCCL